MHRVDESTALGFPDFYVRLSADRSDLAAGIGQGDQRLLVRARYLHRVLDGSSQRVAGDDARASDEAFAFCVEIHAEYALLAHAVLRVDERLQAFKAEQVPDLEDSLARQTDQLLIFLVAHNVHDGEQVAGQFAGRFVQHERIKQTYYFIAATGCY